MGILRFKKENYGSLILIEYVPAWQVMVFNAVSRGQIIAGGIVLQPGCDWQAIYCSQDSMGHRQTQARDNNGDPWNQQVVGFVPGDEDEIEIGLQQLHNQRYIVRVTRPNGVIRIAGTPIEPLDLKLDSNTQETYPGVPGTSVQFSGITKKRALTVI